MVMEAIRWRTRLLISELNDAERDYANTLLLLQDSLVRAARLYVSEPAGVELL